jgi:hypothetical protein
MRLGFGFLRMTTALKAILIITATLAIADQSYGKSQRKPPGVPISWKKVPAGVQATLEGNANGGKIKEVQTGAVNGLVFYCGEVKGTDGKWNKVYVKEDGTLIRVEPDNARNKRKHKPLFGD